jgi:hypothetical protein
MTQVQEINSESQKFGNVEYLERMLEGAIAANDGTSAQNIRARLKELREAQRARGAPVTAAAKPGAPAADGSEPAAAAEESDAGAAPPTAPAPTMDQVLKVQGKVGPVGKAPFQLRDILDSADAALLKKVKVTTIPQLLNFLKVYKTPMDALLMVEGLGPTKAQRILGALLSANIDIEIEEKD